MLLFWFLLIQLLNASLLHSTHRLIRHVYKTQNPSLNAQTFAPVRISTKAHSNLREIPPIEAFSQITDSGYQQLFPHISFRDYKFGHLLGQGSFGVVREAVQRSTGTKVALKLIDFENPKNKPLQLRKELKMMIQCSQQMDEIQIRHKYWKSPVMKIVDWGINGRHLVFVTELGEGGDLAQFMDESGALNEYELRKTAISILKALLFLQSLHIVHRDIKPENIYFRTPRKDFDDLILGDLGLANDLSSVKPYLNGNCGTVGYMAPEMMSGKCYQEKVDIFSFGATLYTLYMTNEPFFQKESRSSFETNDGAPLETKDSERWKLLSPKAQDFILKCLKLNPNERLSVQEAFKHPFITDPLPANSDEGY